MVSTRRRALTRAGGWRSARVPLDPGYGRREGSWRSGEWPHPHPRVQPQQSPAEKTRGFDAARPATWWSPLGMRNGARPKAREIAGMFDPARAQPESSPDARTGWRSGQSSANPSLRPDSLICGKIQGIRSDTGSAGLAIGPDSLPCTGAYAPRSLPLRTGNGVPRSTDSSGHDLPRKVPGGRGAGRGPPPPSHGKPESRKLDSTG